MKSTILAIVLAAISTGALAKSEQAVKLTCGDDNILLVAEAGQQLAIVNNKLLFAGVSQITFSSSKVTAFAPLLKGGVAATGKSGFMISTNVEADGLYSLLSGNVQIACNAEAVDIDK